MADEKKATTMVKYIAIKPCFFKGVWLDRNGTIELPSTVKVEHAALKPYDEKLVSKRLEELNGSEIFDPIKDALGKRRINEATIGLNPRI